MKLFLVGYEADIMFCNKNMVKADKEIFILSDTRGVDELQTVDWTEYDMVVLAINDEELCDGMIQILSTLGLTNEKILNFYHMYQATLPHMIAERRMLYSDISEYMGMILGISHAEVGILPRCFSEPVCNLAVSSQDIFYNLKTLQYCIKNFPEKVRNLKYLIFDMFDYTYFNYDNSLSRVAPRYYMWGGYIDDGHNFNENKHFNHSFDELRQYCCAPLSLTCNYLP